MRIFCNNLQEVINVCKYLNDDSENYRIVKDIEKNFTGNKYIIHSDLNRVNAFCIGHDDCFRCDPTICIDEKITYNEFIRGKKFERILNEI